MIDSKIFDTAELSNVMELAGNYCIYILPDCLRSRQPGQRGAGRLQIQLDGSPADVCIRLARFRGSHQPGRMGLCGYLSIRVTIYALVCQTANSINCFCDLFSNFH